MPQTVEVRFKGTRRDFFHWPDAEDPLRLHDAVVVQADRGQDLGRVHSAGATAELKCGSACRGCERGTADTTPLVATEEAPSPEALAEGSPAEPPGRPAADAPALRPILRRASAAEIRQADELRHQEEEARRQIAEKVRHHRLEMKVSDTEWQFDRGKLTVFFTAEKRVDFRTLVRELASTFRTRIELRQIGVRDEAARLGGVGRCGREYCCSTWLGELTPVSLALAKDQHLSLNPTQISGGCGRLLCCLKYEHEFYVAARKRFPREGKSVQTGRGKERVVAVDIFRERVFLRHDEQGSRIIPLVQLREEMEHPVEEGTPVPAAGAARTPPRAGPTRESRPAPDRAAGPRPGQPPRGGRPERRPAPPPPPASPLPPKPSPEPPAAEAVRPAGEAPRKRRRRRGRRGGRGPGGGSPPPPAPEA